MAAINAGDIFMISVYPNGRENNVVIVSVPFMERSQRRVKSRNLDSLLQQVAREVICAERLLKISAASILAFYAKVDLFFDNSLGPSYLLCFRINV